MGISETNQLLDVDKISFKKVDLSQRVLDIILAPKTNPSGF
jgi:hypothetical protein